VIKNYFTTFSLNTRHVSDRLYANSICLCLKSEAFLKCKAMHKHGTSHWQVSYVCHTAVPYQNS